MKLAILLLLGCVTIQLSYAQNSEQREYAPPLPLGAAYYQQQLSDQVQRQMDKIDWAHVPKTASAGSVLYTVPVVVHVLHNYGPELVADTIIYKMIAGANSLFLKTTPDTVNIIDKFKPLAANTQIAFKLATIDPAGNATKGVDHIFTYLTYYDNARPDEAKLNQWPQDKYLNIWILTPVSMTYAVASGPIAAQYQPFYDGITMPYSALYDSWMARSMAEYLNLPYPCSYEAGYCTDNDMIADTPPCDGEYYACTSTSIYDTVCDTPNTQNVRMNGELCGIMFTYGQAQYMQYILDIDMGKRDSLVTPYAGTVTGMGQPMPDLTPTADFSVGPSFASYSFPPVWFYCQGKQVVFRNQSWNDTITDVAWTFSNNANTPTSTLLAGVGNQFHQPGWVTVSLSATGNNTGTATLTKNQALYVADSISTNSVGYVQEFTPGPGMDAWPMFNYYNNGFRWQQANTGFLDNNSLEYISYDDRSYPDNMTGSPQGDIDDVFTPAFDLTTMTGDCYLNFMSSGATRTAVAHQWRDTLEFDYSIDQAQHWTRFKALCGHELDNAGVVATPYAPASMGDWVAHAIAVPTAARTAYTLFRLRYHPGASDTTGISTGNNFYLDHFSFDGLPLGIAGIDPATNGISILPNPTRGSSYVIIKDKAAIGDAAMMITDMSGRVVYKAASMNNGNTVRMEIPAIVLTQAGLYLVHITTGTINETEKLVVY